ncbi:MAG TPA: S9 family peptidase [Bacillota bacterium]|nr:S9 family peptidase [Bacillota bacterium]
MTPADVYRFRWAGDPQLRPDADEVAYAVRWADPGGKGFRSEIRRWVPAGDRPFYPGPGRDFAPRWSPDGRRLAFLSDRGGSVQLWVADPEPRQLTDLPFPPGAPTWSPDGERLAFVAWQRDPAGPAEPGYSDDVKVIRRLGYKTDGIGFHQDRHRQAFVCDVAGACRPVTEGPFDHASPAWSPDGRWLAVAARRDEGADLTMHRDIWCVEVDGGRLVRATPDGLTAQDPAWAPDGRQIAFVGHTGAHGRATLQKLWVARPPLYGGGPEAHEATPPGWDREARSLIGGGASDLFGARWSPDGQTIYFFSADGGQSRLLALASGEVREVLGDARSFLGLSLEPATGRYAVAATDALTPGDLWLGHLGEAGEQRLTDCNPWLQDLSVPQRFSVTTAEGLQVEGWAMPPAAAAGPAPTILCIHGGPHAAYGDSFLHEFQAWAGMGFAVVYCNPRGSTGYGQDFCTLVGDHWGLPACRDVLDVMEAAVARFPFIDGGRLGVTGSSFGGSLTNWIVAHSDRFRAAVTQATVSNRHNLMGDSDIAYHTIREYGTPWDNPQHYLDSSALMRVASIHTPLLIIHSEQDLRSPAGQAEQLFTALRWLGRTVELALYPGESHGLAGGQPRHRIDRIWRIARWFQRHL